MTIRWRGFFSSTLVFVIIFVVACLAWVYMTDYKDTAAEFNQVSVGMPEQAVRSLLKEPYRELESDEVATNFDLQGWTRDSWKGTGKVLIYIKGDVICYVYLDLGQMVEHVFIGGS